MKPSAHSALPKIVNATKGPSGTLRAPAGNDTNVRASGSSLAIRTATVPRRSIS
jgi:hypothetical protein